MADFGYDISDFRAIDPIFGTMDDFKELLAALKYRGINLSLIFSYNFKIYYV
jgi:glycosidase